MKNNELCVIKLYTKKEFKGKFYLKFEDAKQIIYWWINQDKNNKIIYEKIN